MKELPAQGTSFSIPADLPTTRLFNDEEESKHKRPKMFLFDTIESGSGMLGDAELLSPSAPSEEFLPQSETTRPRPSGARRMLDALKTWTTKSPSSSTSAKQATTRRTKKTKSFKERKIDIPLADITFWSRDPSDLKRPREDASPTASVTPCLTRVGSRSMLKDTYMVKNDELAATLYGTDLPAPSRTHVKPIAPTPPPQAEWTITGAIKAAAPWRHRPQAQLSAIPDRLPLGRSNGPTPWTPPTLGSFGQQWWICSGPPPPEAIASLHPGLVPQPAAQISPWQYFLLGATPHNIYSGKGRVAPRSFPDSVAPSTYAVPPPPPPPPPPSSIPLSRLGAEAAAATADRAPRWTGFPAPCSRRNDISDAGSVSSRPRWTGASTSVTHVQPSVASSNLASLPFSSPIPVPRAPAPTPTAVDVNLFDIPSVPSSPVPGDHDQAPEQHEPLAPYMTAAISAPSSSPHGSHQLFSPPNHHLSASTAPSSCSSASRTPASRAPQTSSSASVSSRSSCESAAQPSALSLSDPTTVLGSPGAPCSSHDEQPRSGRWTHGALLAEETEERCDYSSGGVTLSCFLNLDSWPMESRVDFHCDNPASLLIPARDSGSTGLVMPLLATVPGTHEGSAGAMALSPLPAQAQACLEDEVMVAAGVGLSWDSFDASGDAYASAMVEAQAPLLVSANEKLEELDLILLDFAEE